MDVWNRVESRGTVAIILEVERHVCTTTYNAEDSSFSAAAFETGEGNIFIKDKETEMKSRNIYYTFTPCPK